MCESKNSSPFSIEDLGLLIGEVKEEEKSEEYAPEFELGIKLPTNKKEGVL